MVARRYLSTPEAADYLSVTVDMLDGYCSNGDIAYIRVTRNTRRFDITDLDAFMRARRVEATA